MKGRRKREKGELRCRGGRLMPLIWLMLTAARLGPGRHFTRHFRRLICPNLTQEVSDMQDVLLDLTRRYQEAGYFPSACVRVFNRRETLAEIHVGEVTADSVFDVASLTKLATATQVLHLVSAGRLHLTDPIGTHLSEVEADAFLRQRLREVTLYRLLTHTSSLPAWHPFYALGDQSFFGALRRVLEQAPAEQGVVYSDLNFMLLGLMLQRVQGKPLERCLQEDLVEPLGLGVMTYKPEPDLPLVPSCYGNPIEEDMCRERGIAFDGFRPHNVPVAGQANDGNCFYYFHGVSGHAGIFAQAEAYQRLCQYYMTTADPLLALSTREQPDAPGRGLGWQTGLSYPHGCGHTGFTGTGVYFSREKDIGVISFTNRLFYPRPNPNATWEFRRVLHETALGCALAGNR